MPTRGDLPASFELGFQTCKREGTPNKAVGFETALALTGFGKFQCGLVFVCGLAFFASGYQNGLSAYVIPAAQCDLQMSSEDKGLLNAVFLIGGISSAFFWGILADHVGRRKVLVTSLFLDGLVSFLSAFSQSFGVYATFRFLNGFITGAPGSITCTYLGEFISVRQRARCVTCLGIFFTLSWLLLPLVAMGVLPLPWKIETNGFLFNSWRLFACLTCIPSLVSGLLLYFMFPESPKFLYSKGNEAEALDVMKRMYEINRRHGRYPVETILPDSTEGARRSIIQDPDELAHIRKSAKNGKRLDVILAGVWRQALAMFKPPNLNATSLAAALMFCNMFGYYGLGLWLPELFDRFDQHYKGSNVSVTVCELTRMGGTLMTMDNKSIVVDPTEEYCKNTDINSAVYLNTIIIGAACLVGNIVCSLIADKLGLKIISVLTMAVSGVCALAIYFLNKSSENLIVSCFFLSFVGVANIVISSAVCDLFPTRIRALAVCAAMLAGRLGAVLSNLILGYVLDSLCEVPVFLMAGTLLLGAILCLLLPGKYSNRISPEN